MKKPIVIIAILIAVCLLWAFVKAEEYVFKLVHTGVGKQQRRVVVRHERGRADDGVAFGFEEF